nr:reverse transcriptase domain-containing protein [Tanacetum cinerariifolium]
LVCGVDLVQGVGDGVVVFVGCRVVGEWVMEVAGKRGRMNSRFDFKDMDNIGTTPAGIIRSTLGGPLEIDVETPRTGNNLSAWEHIEGHLLALRSLLKEHNGRGNVSLIHMSFDDVEDRTRARMVVTGKEIEDADLKRPFKEAVKTLLTRRIIEFAGPEFKMPTNIKLYDGTTYRKITLVDSHLQQTLGNGHAGVVSYVPTNLGRECEGMIVETCFIMGVPEFIKISSFMDDHKFPELAKRYSDKVPKTMDEMMMRLDDFVRLEEAFASTELPKGEASGPFENHRGRCNSHLRKKTKTSTVTVTEKKDTTLMIVFSQEETRNGLESRKLNHLIKDVRHRGRGAKGRDVGKDKVINMIRSWPNKIKRKSFERDESWMKAPIVFPPLSMKDDSDEPLIIEAVMEGYLVRRVYVDQGASVEVMFKH